MIVLGLVGVYLASNLNSTEGKSNMPGKGVAY
jgi:hypothetical protein